MQARNPSIITFNKDILWIVLFICFSIALIFKASLQICLFAGLLFFSITVINTNFKTVLMLLICSIPITRFPIISEYVEVLKVAVFALVFLSWVFSKDFSSLREFKGNPLNIFFICFILLMFFNLVSSTDVALTFNTSFTHILSFGYFFIFFDIFKEKEFLKKAVNLFIVIGVLVSVLAIIQYLIMHYRIFTGLAGIVLPYNQRYDLYFGPGIFRELLGYRSVGMFYHANLLGVFLSLVFPLNCCLLFTENNGSKKMILMLSALIILIGDLCSGSRGSILSIAVSCFFLLIIFWKKISKPLIFLFLSASIPVLIIFWNKIIPFLRLEEILSYRDVIWKNTWELIQQRPFAGLGLGTFFKTHASLYGFPSVFDFNNILQEVTITGSTGWLQGLHAHNLFLNYTVEMGVFAALFLGIYYIIYFSRILGVFKSKPLVLLNNYEYCLAAGVISVMAGNFVYSFLESSTNFYNFSISIAFIFISAIGMSLLYPRAK